MIYKIQIKLIMSYENFINNFPLVIIGSHGIKLRPGVRVDFDYRYCIPSQIYNIWQTANGLSGSHELFISVEKGGYSVKQRRFGRKVAQFSAMFKPMRMSN